MTEYKLIVNEDGVVILNEASEPINNETALALMDLLDARYEHPACVYVIHNATMGRL